jgi:hypothetical protein
MKAIACSDADLGSRRPETVARSVAPGSVAENHKALLAEVHELGGEERICGAQGALEAFQTAPADLVRENPKRYGAGADAASQERIVAQLIDSVSRSYLSRTVAELRGQAGYIKIWGYWVHRAVFTFLGFGLLAAGVLPLCAVSLLSASAWGWLPGALGLLFALVIGVWILTRIRNR